MKIQKLHPNFRMPTYGSEFAGAFDLYMPERGYIFPNENVTVDLGFAAAIPPGHVGLILPRSGMGVRHGLELNNTCGVIDADYRGEWKACLRTKDGEPLNWEAGDRLLQVLVVPVAHVTLTEDEELPETGRGAGGFGSTGK